MPSPSSYPSLPPSLPILRDEPEVLGGSLLGKGTAVSSKALLAGDISGCAAFSESPREMGPSPRASPSPRDGARPGRGGSGRAGGGRMSAP